MNFQFTVLVLKIISVLVKHAKKPDPMLVEDY